MPNIPLPSAPSDYGTTDLSRTINVLNNFMDTFLGGLDLAELVPVYYAQPESITIFSNNEGAFDLASPNSGSMRFLQPTTVSNNGAIVNKVVSYSWAARIANDSQGYSKFAYDMALIVNNMLLTATNELGYLGGLDPRTVTFGRPGNMREYFRDMEHTAGFELRLYIAPREEQDANTDDNGLRIDGN
jgi:hypothetical protein